jgi:hypothetical protein
MTSYDRISFNKYFFENPLTIFLELFVLGAGEPANGKQRQMTINSEDFIYYYCQKGDWVNWLCDRTKQNTFLKFLHDN